ncbi:agmatinase family protein [Sedimentibacter sp.]|uniref:agmatinase family protein n=1 Tax=Sedimentibacter sp. TaxID=1960295 RepID=UPI00289D2702|nr:agmatinase family protein [Sedimentibacter sp.]
MKIKYKNKFGIMGMTYDTSASKGYPGARYAPEQIRKSLQWIKNRVEDNMLFDVEANRLIDFTKLEIKDFGDTNQISRYDNKQSLEEIKNNIDKIYQEGYSPILLGGDHSTGWPGIKALYDNTEGNIGIIHVDAHLDLVKDSPIQGLYSGSSQMRRASELDRINTKNFVQIGMRSYNSPEHYHFIKNSNITLIPANEVFETSIEEAAKKAIEVASEGTDHIYMSIDIDVLDSAFAPGSGANEPGGFTSYQLFKFVKLVAPYVDAIDIVEVNPMTDFNNMTSIVASKLLFDYIISNYYAVEDSEL